MAVGSDVAGDLYVLVGWNVAAALYVAAGIHISEGLDSVGGIKKYRARRGTPVGRLIKPAF